MNKALVAKELLAIAREFVAIDFPTKDAYDKYMDEHPDADRSNHKVVETKKDEPATEELDEDLRNFSHGHGMSKSDGKQWTHPSKQDILKRVKETVAEYEKALHGHGYDRNIKKYVREKLPTLKKLLKKHEGVQ